MIRILALAFLPAAIIFCSPVSFGQEPTQQKSSPEAPTSKPATDSAKSNQDPAPPEPPSPPVATNIKTEEKPAAAPQDKAGPAVVIPDAKPNSEKEETKKPRREKKSIPSLGSTKNARIPGQPWRIHDARRPRPHAVQPGSSDSAPPGDAIVLFDGTDLSQWCHRGTDDELFEPMWKIENGYMEITPQSGSIYTLDSFGSCQLHLEWFIPEQTRGSGQGRGNSGIKIMERYEVQILDSFKSRTYADGQAGAIYGQVPPLVNASRPQGQWQSYDIFFEAPVFENDRLVSRPHVTVIHNGILVQHHQVVNGPTGAQPGDRDAPIQPAAPIMLQDHGNPIRFRNIWLREL